MVVVYGQKNVLGVEILQGYRDSNTHVQNVTQTYKDETNGRRPFFSLTSDTTA